MGDTMAITRGSILPDLSLPSAPDGAPVRLRAPGRRAPLLLVLEGGGTGARDYLRRVAEAHASIDEWDGRVLAVIPGALDAARALWEGAAPLPFPVLADPEGRLAARLGPAAFIVADQWGEVHHAEAGLPAPEELAEWARFLAIQCPECQGEAL